MPRAKIGVQQMRVQADDEVHILAHRLSFVAWRMSRWNARRRDELLVRLKIAESQNCVYTVQLRAHTGLTGLVHVTDGAGNRYSAHHTDLVRV